MRKNHKRLESSILIFSTIVLVASLYLLNNDNFIYGHNSHSKETIGSIQINGKAKLKGSKQFYWRNITKQSNVHSNETIYTEDNTTAKLELNSGSKVKIGSNTLITLDENTGTIIMDQGSLEVLVGQRIKLKIKGKDFKLKGKFKAQTNERNEVSITAISDEVEVNGQVVKKDTSINLSPEPIQTKISDIHLQGLKDIYWVTEDPSDLSRLKINWKKIQNTTSYNVKVLSKVTPPQTTQSVEPKFEIDFSKLVEGEYKIHIEAYNQNKLQASVSDSFLVKKRIPPQEVSLFEEYVIDQQEQKAPVQVTYSQDYPTDYEFQFYNLSESKMYSFIDNNSPAQFNLPAGEYKMQVKSLANESFPQSSLSAQRLFKIHPHISLETPIFHGRSNEELTLNPKDDNQTDKSSIHSIEWSKVLNADFYEVTISSTPKFNDIKIISTSKTTISRPQLEARTEYFKVRAVNKNGRLSEQSQVKKVSSFYPPVKRLSSKINYFKDGKIDYVHIEWFDPLDVNDYMVTVHNTQSNKQWRRLFTTEKSIKIPSPPVGTIKVEVTYKKPKQKINQREIASISINLKHKAAFEQLKFIALNNRMVIPYTKRDETKVTWLDKKYEFYELQISKDKNFSLIEFSAKTVMNEKMMDLTDFKPGVYFARLRGSRSDVASDWSKTLNLELRPQTTNPFNQESYFEISLLTGIKSIKQTIGTTLSNLRDGLFTGQYQGAQIGYTMSHGKNKIKSKAKIISVSGNFVEESGESGSADFTRVTLDSQYLFESQFRNQRLLYGLGLSYSGRQYVYGSGDGYTIKKENEFFTKGSIQLSPYDFDNSFTTGLDLTSSLDGLGTFQYNAYAEFHKVIFKRLFSFGLSYDQYEYPLEIKTNDGIYEGNIKETNSSLYFNYLFNY